MKIYTKTGDEGLTGILGSQRLRKDDARIEAYGTVDELNAVLGVARAGGLDASADALDVGSQNDFAIVGQNCTAAGGGGPLAASTLVADDPSSRSPKY